MPPRRRHGGPVTLPDGRRVPHRKGVNGYGITVLHAGTLICLNPLLRLLKGQPPAIKTGKPGREDHGAD